MKLRHGFKVTYLETMTPDTMNYMIDYSDGLADLIRREKCIPHKNPAQRKNISRFEVELTEVKKFIIDCQEQLIKLKYKQNGNEINSQ